MIEKYKKLSMYKDMDFVVRPLLEELIEACGNRFEGLQLGTWTNKETNKPYWYAKSVDDLLEDGDTPGEAVAKLWLAINEIH